MKSPVKWSFFALFLWIRGLHQLQPLDQRSDWAGIHSCFCPCQRFEAFKIILIIHIYIHTLSGWWFGTWLLFFHNIYILIPLVMTNIAMYEPFLQPPLTKCLHQLLSYWQFFFYPLVMTNIAMEAMAHRNRWCSQRSKPPFIWVFQWFFHV